MNLDLHYEVLSDRSLPWKAAYMIEIVGLHEGEHLAEAQAADGGS